MLVIIRFYSLSIITVGDTYPRTLLLILGTLSILVAALCIFKQDDIKRRFAYSSVDNVGVVALCLGIGGPLGIAACCCTASSTVSRRRSPSAWPVTSSTSTTPAT